MISEIYPDDDGTCLVVGYDDERGKGHNRNLEGRELPYAFATVERLVADFLADVRRIRGSL